MNFGNLGNQEMKGGDVIIYAGKGFQKDPNFKPVGGDIIFKNGREEEVLRFRDDGRIEVQGRTVSTDLETVNLFKEWLKTACHIQP